MSRTSLESDLHARSQSACELCGATDDLAPYEVPPTPDGTADTAALLCATCRTQLDDPAQTDPNHWRCLNDAMWTPVPAVQVLAWRMLDRLRPEGWPQDLLDQLYLDDETLAWAQAGAQPGTTPEGSPEGGTHKDAHGNVLHNGDTVHLIKDLDVKGANFTAKRGTPVRNISLVPDNPEHIEGRVSGQQIVILTKFVKRAT